MSKKMQEIHNEINYFLSKIEEYKGWAESLGDNTFDLEEADFETWSQEEKDSCLIFEDFKNNFNSSLAPEIEFCKIGKFISRRDIVALCEEIVEYYEDKMSIAWDEISILTFQEKYQK